MAATALFALAALAAPGAVNRAVDSDPRAEWALVAHYTLEAVVDGLVEPVALAAPTVGPAAGSCWVLERSGALWTVTGARKALAVGTRSGAVSQAPERCQLAGEGGPRQALDLCASARGQQVVLLRRPATAAGPQAEWFTPSCPSGPGRGLQIAVAHGGARCALEPTALIATTGDELLRYAANGATELARTPTKRAIEDLLSPDRGLIALVSTPGGLEGRSLAAGTSIALATQPWFAIEGARAPARLAYASRHARGFPPARGGRLFVADRQRVWTIELDPTKPTATALGPPQLLLEGRTGDSPAIRDIAFGEDALFVLTVNNDSENRADGAVLRVDYDPAAEYPYPLGAEPLIANDRDAAAHAVMHRRGCFACHSLQGKERVGPSLDRASLVPRLEERLNDKAYASQLDQLDALVPDPSLLDVDVHEHYLRLRRDVRGRTGRDKVKTWLVHHILAPAFDKPDAKMPDLGVTQAEAEAISQYLMRE